MDKWLKQTPKKDDPPQPSKAKDITRTSRNFSNSWLEIDEFKDWLVKRNSKTGTTEAYCKFCDVVLSCHKTELKRHRLSKRHNNNSSQVIGQLSVSKVFKLSSVVQKQRILELKLSAMLATNNLSFSLIDTLTSVLKNSVTDSDIVKNFTLKRTKATAIIKNVISRCFLSDLCTKLQGEDCFNSIIMDETTDIAEIKQCGMIIIYYDENKMCTQTKFFDLVETPSGTADHLTNTLLACLNENNIPLDWMIGFSSDTTNVMAGSKHSVFTNLKEAVPNVALIKCSCHMIHLSASKACLKLPRSVEEMLRNIGSHFSRTYSRQKKFSEYQLFFQVEIHKILSPSIRWLSLHACVKRILEQYTPLKEYFRLECLEDPSKTNKNIFDCLNNEFTIVYLQFMNYLLGLLTDFNCLFQTEGPMLHKVKPEVEKLLKTICLNFMIVDYVRATDVFIITPDSEKHFITLHNIYIGIDAYESINNLKTKDVPECEITKFYLSCRDFYIELVTDIKKRFIFTDPLYDFLKVVDIKNVKSFSVPTLAPLLNRFPILNNHVNPQHLDQEWRDLALMDGLDIDNDKEDVEKFWRNVFSLKKVSGKMLYPNLFKVIKLLLVLPHSNAAVERLFSDLKNCKTFHRNQLNTSTLASLLRVKDNIDDAAKFEPPKEMIEAKAWDAILKEGK